MIEDNEDIKVLLAVLKEIPLFTDLNEESHREIIKRIILMYYPSNYTIFNQGDEGDSLYIIKKGTVEIFHPENEENPEKSVAEIYDGGFFGEMALISDVPRNASAKSITDLEVFILSKDDFKNLLNSNKVLAEQISATVVHRLKDNEK